MGKIFSFNNQLNIGDEGERLFKQCYRNLDPQKSKDRKVDFLLSDGTKIEVKCDTYGMLDTPNFFMEEFSNKDSMTLGGPWRAVQDDVDYFVYLFLSQKVFFWFEPLKLVTYLDKIKHKAKKREIRNRGWITMGYLIPRKDCIKYCESVDSF